MRSILCIVFICIPVLIFCQEYGGTNATWIYDFMAGANGVTEVRSTGDTIIGDRLIRVYKKTTFYLDEYNEVLSLQRNPVYIHSKEGVVEFSTDLINFDTLYNFQLAIGDSWSIPERNSITGEVTGEVFDRIIVDTFTLNIGEGSVFCQETISVGGTVVDTIFQDFGSRYSYILPFENFLQYGEATILRCFRNDELGHLDFEADLLAICPSCSFSDFEYDCKQLSTITSNPISNTDIHVFPNPAADYFNIRSKEKPIYSFAIFNLSGQLIIDEKCDAREIKVETIGLSDGMYFLLINERYFEKLVVDHQ